MDEQTNYYQQQLLSLASKSKQEFIQEYKMYNEVVGRGIYIQTLTQLAKAISEGNVKSLEKTCNLIAYMGDVKSEVTLKDYYNDASNPIRDTNVVILACKHNQHEVLKFIFNNNVSIRVGKDAIVPDDKDETCHDAFYYAIRSGNVRLLDLLINMWPDNYFAARSDELDVVLSKGYEALKLKNVLLSDDMEIFVEDVLLNLRFSPNNSGQVQCTKDVLNNFKERIDLILENILLLQTEYLNEKEVDERFLFIAKFIAQNVSVLKRQLKSTYVRLPWEELEFCLISFISCHVKRQEINLFYRSTLNKFKILQHLETFADKLKEERDSMEGEVDIAKLSNLPKLRRAQVVEKITNNCPQFKELYKDHQQIRDNHSLEQINNYIVLASTADPKERLGQLIITRALQVIGEFLKNSLESPKLSSTTSDLLLLTLPKQTRKVIVDLRNSLSHAYSLAKRTEIEENQDFQFYLGVQSDTNKVGAVVTDILYKNKLKILRTILETISSSDSLEEMKAVATVLSTVELDKWSTDKFETLEHNKLDKLLKELDDNIADKTSYETEMLAKINHIIKRAGERSGDIQKAYTTGYSLLKSLASALQEEKIDHNGIRVLKFQAKQILQLMTPEIEAATLKEISMLMANIFRSVIRRRQCDKFLALASQIFCIAEFETGDIKYMEELGGKLNEKGDIPYKPKKAVTYKKQLALKLTELKEILNRKLSVISKSTETLSLYRKDTKLQAVVEMMVLDIMSILGRSNNYLENNLLFLDDNSPLLNGKCLRNHLAHSNAVVDILLCDPSLAVILNAIKLTEENIVKSKSKIGKFVIDDPKKLKGKYHEAIDNITLQERMFVALEEGDFESLMECLRQGADIKAKNINSWTTLHFAAKASNLAVIKFILRQKLNPNVWDTNGQSPLHVAAACGRKHNVMVLLQEAGLYVDGRDNAGKTPLHVAASNGCRDTVEVLLKNQANTASHDLSGLTPLHHAIRNNHIATVKILLAKDVNVDFNMSVGGFTPLHQTAELGYVEMVTFLLQNGANANARNYQNWVPLHAAALNGHVEIVKALIKNGAGVRARNVDGCTPLHYATENGHEQIVVILLKNGANVNAADNTFHNTALHYAAKDGYPGIVKILLENKADASVGTVVGRTALHLAAESTNLDIVAALLRHGVDIQSKDAYKNSPLHYAVGRGRAEVVELLLEEGAEVNARSADGTTPLHIATLKGLQVIVDLLLRNEATVDAEDIKGSTPLHMAAINGSVGVIYLLLREGCDVNPRTREGLIPLNLAALNGHLEATSFLIKNKADVNARAECGFTPLHSAVAGGHKDVVRLLITNKAQIDAEGIAGITPLQMAVEVGHKEIADILIANGAYIDDKALLAAVKANHKEFIEMLIANGANVNGAPLQLAVFAGHKEIVDIFLKNKADVNIRDDENATPLHLAARRGCKDIAIVLIKSGAEVNATTSSNVTPLYLAAQGGHGEVVEVLIKNGARINVTTFNGNALHIAAGQGHASVVEILLKNGAKINAVDPKNRTALELAVAHGHLEIVKMLLKHKKVNMNLKNGNWTILHIASQESSLEMVKYLVAEGSDINVKNELGSKAIHLAAREGYQATVEFFLSKGLSIDEPGMSNQTLLHYAAMNGQSEVVRYLVSQGADVNARDANDVCPIVFAAKFGHKEVVEVLLKNGAIYNPTDGLHRTPHSVARDKNVIELLETTKKLFEAVKHNNSSEVESCIAAGAIVNSRNSNGVTPLHVAAWKGYEAVVNVLLKHKADPEAAKSDGTTCLHYAAKFSHLNVVMTLLSNGAVYNAVSCNGKTPLAFSADQTIKDLFILICESFKNIKRDSSKVITDLNKIKNVDTIKAIMCARNKEGATLIVAADQSNYSYLEQLKQIAQGDIASELSSQGNYKKTLEIFRRALEKRKQILGPDNPATLEIQTHIAKVLYRQGFYEEALNAYADILQKQTQELGLNNKATLSTRNLIALVLHRQGKDEEAFNIFQEVYQKQTEILGPHHSDTLETLFHMALVFERQGKYEEALKANRRVFEKRNQELGVNDPRTVSAHNNIAMVLASQGKYTEALTNYKEVYEKKKIVFGIHHPDTLRTLHNIAGVLQMQKNYSEALATQQQVLDIQQNVLGPNHPDTLATQYDMANTMFLQHKWISALKAYRECLAQSKTVLGPSHPSVLDSLRKLEMIKEVFRMQGCKECEILQHLQKQLNIAASNGDAQTVSRLIKTGADVNDRDVAGRTPLHFATNKRQIAIVNILLEAGADVTQVTNKGNTPLHTAVSKGDKEIVEALLQHVHREKLNDFVNAKTTAGGTTALQVALKSGHLDIANCLVAHGAIVDIIEGEVAFARIL